MIKATLDVKIMELDEILQYRARRCYIRSDVQKNVMKFQ